jgi:hypothetical protein
MTRATLVSAVADRPSRRPSKMKVRTRDRATARATRQAHAPSTVAANMAYDGQSKIDSAKTVTSPPRRGQSFVRDRALEPAATPSQCGAWHVVGRSPGWRKPSTCCHLSRFASADRGAPRNRWRTVWAGRPGRQSPGARTRAAAAGVLEARRGPRPRASGASRTGGMRSSSPVWQATAAMI